MEAPGTEDAALWETEGNRVFAESGRKGGGVARPPCGSAKASWRMQQVALMRALETGMRKGYGIEEMKAEPPKCSTSPSGERTDARHGERLWPSRKLENAVTEGRGWGIGSGSNRSAVGAPHTSSGNITPDTPQGSLTVVRSSHHF
ncbi:hypothetical protein cyc_03542 [Cyclospora cayetanensis]|uniref:Uncharacterized protein n=1 Tax=Cyclospora cayetanensis TaxID=88456 RepID=A0A1D3CW39_9EIME|nr:hypothetical protein cyc_03542 [Cyclospora cayetanensis]